MSIKIAGCLTLALLLHITVMKAQNTYQLGTLPAFNLNTSLGNDWAVNFKGESRLVIKDGAFSAPVPASFDHDRTDLALTFSKKVGLNNALAAGYLMRIREGMISHRSLQQFTIVRRYTTFRLAHRFSADQTWQRGNAVEWRCRYRITAEFPLNGESVDRQEFYLKINNEYLNSLQGDIYDLEVRIVPLVGYVFTDSNKVEFGLDYRLSGIAERYSRSSFWLSLSWYVKM